MRKNSFDFEAHLSRHPHNVSAGFTGSLTTGPLVPQYFDILGPGDKIYFTPKAFARLQDIVAPFFGEVDLHFDAFFVPMQMMYTLFGQVFAQTNDVVSNFYTKGGNVVQKDTFPMLATAWHSGIDVRTVRGLSTNECLGKETMRLLDGLNCNPFSVLSDLNIAQSGSPAGISQLPEITFIPEGVSPWAFAAYQAIYQKFFRNDDIERFDIDAYNFDSYYQSPIFNADKMWRLRYVQRPSDYFTSLKVSPISSAVNSSIAAPSDAPGIPASFFPTNGGTLNNILNKVNDYLGFSTDAYSYGRKFPDNSNTYPIIDTVLEEDLASSVSSFGGSTIGNNDSWFPTAANIRALFAVDKFTRIYGRAGKTYDEQIQAHFGIDIPKDIKHDATRIGHWRMSLVAEPVYSTADTGEGGSSIGQVGGQANNTLNAKQTDFTAPVHGVFMIVCHAVTKPRYFMTFDKLHTLTNRLSFPIPSFDKLGMQPLYGFELFPGFLSPYGTQGKNIATRVGWQRRYQEFKQKYNRVSMLYIDPSLNSSFDPSLTNSFSPFTLSRMVLNQEELDLNTSWNSGESSLVPASELFENVNNLNTVMAVPYNGAWSNDYWRKPISIFDTDPIILDFYCDAKKISWMSETGEPDL